MKKLLVISLMALMLFSFYLASASAYSYGGCVGCNRGSYDNDYDSVSYKRVNNNGYMTRYTDYDRSTSSGWYDGDYVTRVTYTRTNRDSYDNDRYYRDFDSKGYARNYRYDNNRYWYQNYWVKDDAYYGNPYVSYGNSRYHYW